MGGSKFLLLSLTLSLLCSPGLCKKIEKSSPPSFDIGRVEVMKAVCGLLILLVIAGTIVDRMSTSNDKKANGRRRCICVFVTAFSLVKTFSTLLSTKQVANSIPSLNGVKVLSTVWIILHHTFLYIGSFKFNRWHRVVTNEGYSVDSFFLISGILVAYLTFHDMKKRNGRFACFYYYVHRYLRLTPSYAFVLFIGWLLTSHVPYLKLGSPYSKACSKYWWTNLLYIHNIYPSFTKMCIQWSWYLSCDMQFYALSPLIIVPAYYLAPLGLGVALAMFLSASMVTAYMVSNLVSGLDSPSEFYGSHRQEYYGNLLLTKPWCRISPYIVGIILGYILYKEIKLPFGRIVTAIIHFLFWIAAGMILTSLLFTHSEEISSTAYMVMYATFSRFAWGVGLALIIFACHNGYGWHINTFLSMRMWIPLSRLSLNVYLVHPIILRAIYWGSPHTTPKYHDLVGLVLLCFGVAMVVCLLVEFPLGTIESSLCKIFGSKETIYDGKKISEGSKKEIEN